MNTKRYVSGTHRIVSPRETIERTRPLLGELGITRVANVTGLDDIGIPTVMVTRPNSRSLSVSQGKGLDLDAAKASGIMEAIEQAHAESVEAAMRLATVGELESSARNGGGPRVVDVSRLPGYVRPFQRSTRIPWVVARVLATGEAVWVPYEMVHLDLTLPLPEGSGHFLAGSNGLASGNHLLEAVSHGLCEVIERDATTLFLARSEAAQDALRLDVRSIDDPACLQLLDLYQRAEVEVALWDLTSDVGVPCVACSIVEASADPFRPVGLARGVGCHPERGVAVARALTEAAQSRLTRIVGSRDDLRRTHVATLHAEATVARHREQLRRGASRPPRRFGELPTLNASTLDEDVDWLCGQIAGVLDEMEVLVVDLSRSGYPVSVARVIVPGLEGLSEVPGYRAGRRAQALAQGVSQ